MTKIEEFGPIFLAHNIWKCVHDIFTTFFKDQLVIAEMQMLSILMKYKKLKKATTLLIVKMYMKDDKLKHDAFENLLVEIKKLTRSWTFDAKVAHRFVLVIIDKLATSAKHLLTRMSRMLGTSTTTLVHNP